MLPAAQGDALWIEYGDREPYKRILIDGGVHAAATVLRQRIEALPVKERVFELGIVTHIDLDHIVGTLGLLDGPPEGLTFKDFWFNAWKHLPESPTDTSTLGAKMGEALSYLLERRGPERWNAAFYGKAVAVGAELPSAADGLKVISLEGGMRLTLLGPTGARLADVKKVWKEEIERILKVPGGAGKDLVGHPEDEVDDSTLGDPPVPTSANDIENLARMNLGKDPSKANGSSIVVLAEYDDKRALLTGDAFPQDVLAAVQLLSEAKGRSTLPIHCLKLSHHGGDKNTSNELIAALACPTYLISTSGARYRHPKVISVARVLYSRPKEGGGDPMLVFNYKSEFTERWDKPARFGAKYRYTPCYPKEQGVNTVEL
jgi:hypothetical protein